MSNIPLRLENRDSMRRGATRRGFGLHTIDSWIYKEATGEVRTQRQSVRAVNQPDRQTGVFWLTVLTARQLTVVITCFTKACTLIIGSSF